MESPKCSAGSLSRATVGGSMVGLPNPARPGLHRRAEMLEEVRQSAGSAAEVKTQEGGWDGGTAGAGSILLSDIEFLLIDTERRLMDI